MFASKSIKIIPSAEFSPEETGYLEFFFNSRESSFMEYKFHLHKTVSKTAIHVLMCIAESSAWIHSLIKSLFASKC